MKRKIIGVIGGSQCSPEISNLAEQVGEGIARNNAILICGGLFGVMEAACRGAKKSNGLTIGVLPGDDAAQANSFVDIAIVTGMGDARNVVIARTADAVIAIDGEYGTLSEIAFCLKFGKPVIGLKSWRVDPRIKEAANPQDAINKALQMLS